VRIGEAKKPGPRERKAGAKRKAGEGERKAGAGDSKKRRKAHNAFVLSQIPESEPRYRNYFSQDWDTCGEAIEIASGPVSLANSLMWRVGYGGMRTPLSLIHLAWGAFLPREAVGLSPVELCALSAIAARPYGLRAQVCEPCDDKQLAAGDMIYVNSIAMKNGHNQGRGSGVQYEDAEPNSHIVMVETITPTTIYVINPDCRGGGYRGSFRADIWGRMLIHRNDLDKIWNCTRSDGTRLCRAAVLLRAKTTGKRVSLYTSQTTQLPRPAA